MSGSRLFFKAYTIKCPAIENTVNVECFLIGTFAVQKSGLSFLPLSLPRVHVIPVLSRPLCIRLIFYQCECRVGYLPVVCSLVQSVLFPVFFGSTVLYVHTQSTL